MKNYNVTIAGITKLVTIDNTETAGQYSVVIDGMQYISNVEEIPEQSTTEETGTGESGDTNSETNASEESTESTSESSTTEETGTEESGDTNTESGTT